MIIVPIKNVSLHNINIHFFPLNATSVLLLMNHGVIWSLKQIEKNANEDYRVTKKWYYQFNFHFVVAEAFQTWHGQWLLQISNCFQHAGLVKNQLISIHRMIFRFVVVSINKLLDLNKFDEYLNHYRKNVKPDLNGWAKEYGKNTNGNEIKNDDGEQ